MLYWLFLKMLIVAIHIATKWLLSSEMHMHLSAKNIRWNDHRYVIT